MPRIINGELITNPHGAELPFRLTLVYIFYIQAGTKTGAHKRRERGGRQALHGLSSGDTAWRGIIRA